MVHCPEIEYEGLKRQACGKSRYQTPKYSEICTVIADNLIDRYKMYLDDGYNVGGFICVNGSPSCGIDFSAIGDGQRRGNEPGIFIEECKKKLNENDLYLNFIGVECLKIDKTLHKIRNMINEMY